MAADGTGAALPTALHKRRSTVADPEKAAQVNTLTLDRRIKYLLRHILLQSSLLFIFAEVEIPQSRILYHRK